MELFWMMVEFGRIIKYLDYRDKDYSPQSPICVPTKTDLNIKNYYFYQLCRHLVIICIHVFLLVIMGSLESSMDVGTWVLGQFSTRFHPPHGALGTLGFLSYERRRRSRFKGRVKRKTKVLVGCKTEGHGAVVLSQNLDTNRLIQKGSPWLLPAIFQQPRPIRIYSLTEKEAGTSTLRGVWKATNGLFISSLSLLRSLFFKKKNRKPVNIPNH